MLRWSARGAAELRVRCGRIARKVRKSFIALQMNGLDPILPSRTLQLFAVVCISSRCQNLLTYLCFVNRWRCVFRMWSDKSQLLGGGSRITQWRRSAQKRLGSVGRHKLRSLTYCTKNPARPTRRKSQAYDRKIAERFFWKSLKVFWKSQKGFSQTAGLKQKLPQTLCQ